MPYNGTRLYFNMLPIIQDLDSSKCLMQLIFEWKIKWNKIKWATWVLQLHWLKTLSLQDLTTRGLMICIWVIGWVSGSLVGIMSWPKLKTRQRLAQWSCHPWRRTSIDTHWVCLLEIHQNSLIRWSDVHNIHPIAHPTGWGIGYLLFVKNIILCSVLSHYSATCAILWTVALGHVSTTECLLTHWPPGNSNEIIQKWFLS